MKRGDEQNTPVRAEAVLVDPGAMTVMWMNESAAEAAAGLGGDATSGVSVDRVLPMAEALGVPQALREVADTGVPRHLRAEVVSMARRSVALVVSVYRLPGGELLMLTEHAWQLGRGKTAGSGPRRSHRS